MYIYKSFFFVYFHLSSDIGPNVFFCDSKLLEKSLPCT